MPAGVEATLEQLDLSAKKQQAAGNNSLQNQQQGQQQQQQEEPDAQDPEPPAALQNTACLAATFSCLEDEQLLVQCSAVCQLWNSVLQSDDIWRRVYLRSLPEPLPFEHVSSYKQQFRRLHGLLAPAEAEPTALKGSALCYNAATGHLVSYNARQRVLSVLMADGSIRSEVADVPGSAGSAHKPLLASTGSELVVLAAADGALQLWDASSCTCSGVLGQHSSFVTSLSGSGHLVASTCSSEMRLWDTTKKVCLFTVPIGLQLPTPSTFQALEPQVAVSHKQQLLALANCSAPVPSSIVKVYSTHPAPPSTKPNSNSSSSSGGRGRKAAASSAEEAAAAAAAAAAVCVVGDSSCPGAVGAMLLKELEVNAAADLKFVQGLLVVASKFNARGVSNNSPFKSERAYTVVINIWDTRTWQRTRLMSPRLWTDTPQYSMQGLPIISISQGIVHCATLRAGSNNAFPSCCVYAMQLPPDVVTAAAAATSSSSSSSDDDAAGQGSNAAAAAAGSSSSRPQAASSSIGTGAMAQGRIQVATVGGIGPVGYKAESTCMLPISDRDRQCWAGREPLIEDTGGRLTVILTTPTQLVMATENGQVLSSQLLPADQQQQQQQADAGAAAAAGAEQGPEAAAAAAAAAAEQGGEGVAAVGPVVHVLEPHGSGSRFIALDL